MTHLHPQPAPSPDNRRRSQRVPLPVLLQVIDDDGPELHRATDVSFTGLSFLVPRHRTPEKTPKRVVVRGALPGTDEVFWALGRVIRGRETEDAVELGVRFTWVSQDNCERLGQYMSAKA